MEQDNLDFIATEELLQCGNEIIDIFAQKGMTLLDMQASLVLLTADFLTSSVSIKEGVTRESYDKALDMSIEYVNKMRKEEGI